jgi:hypothetical protein
MTDSHNRQRAKDDRCRTLTRHDERGQECAEKKVQTYACPHC